MKILEAVSSVMVRSMEEKIVCKLMGKCRVANAAIVRCRPELAEGLQGLCVGVGLRCNPFLKQVQDKLSSATAPRLFYKIKNYKILNKTTKLK
jgi:hypothetical protein